MGSVIRRRMRFRGTDRPRRVIGLIQRRAEHREHRVADELVERPFVLEDDVGHPREELVEQRARPPRRSALLAQRREADDVAEHHRDVALLRDEALVGIPALQDPLMTSGEW